SSNALGYAQLSTGLNRTGRILFQSSLSGGDTVTAAAPAIANNLAWFTGQAGALEMVIRKGDAPPGAAGTAIQTLGSSSQMNDAGQVAYNVILSTTVGGTPAVASNNAEVVLFTPGSGNQKIVRE